MTSPVALPAAVLKQLDNLCRVFEASWKSEGPLDLVALVQAVPPEARPPLFRRLWAIEEDYRARLHRPLPAAEVLARFRVLGDWVEAHLAEQAQVQEVGTLTLTAVEGPCSGATFQFSGHRLFLIGRGKEASLRLRDDPSVSRLHCVVEFNPPAGCVIDAGSGHGTFLDGQRVGTALLTRDRHELKVGNTLFELRIALPADSVPPAALDARPVSESGEPSTVVGPAGLPQLPVPDEFALVRRLGGGGMGEVYLARRKLDGALVALKMIRPAVRPTPEALARFQVEVEIHSQLHHPNIVGYLGSFTARGLPIFALEYVEGCDAEELLRRERAPLAPARLIHLGGQLLAALAHAHERGIVHRDIKPTNLLLTGSAGNETVKLSDFGIAKAYLDSSLCSLTAVNACGGSWGFLPPEQVQDFRSATQAADLYSVAATLYYLGTGQHVYERPASAADVYNRILHEDPIPLRKPYAGPPLPERLLGVLQRGLARKPMRRFPSAMVMREHLLQALEG